MRDDDGDRAVCSVFSDRESASRTSAASDPGKHESLDH
jgi:hypothetical protein